MVACFTDWMTDPEEGDHRSYLNTPSGTNTRIKHADTVHANLDQIVVISSRRGCPIHHLHLLLLVVVVTWKEFLGFIQGLEQRMMCRGPIDWPFVVPPKARTLTELLFLCFLCIKYLHLLWPWTLSRTDTVAITSNNIESPSMGYCSCLLVWVADSSHE